MAFGAHGLLHLRLELAQGSVRGFGSVPDRRQRSREALLAELPIAGLLLAEAAGSGDGLCWIRFGLERAQGLRAKGLELPRHGFPLGRVLQREDMVFDEPRHLVSARRGGSGRVASGSLGIIAASVATAAGRADAVAGFLDQPLFIVLGLVLVQELLDPPGGKRAALRRTTTRRQPNNGTDVFLQLLLRQLPDGLWWRSSHRYRASGRTAPAARGGIRAAGRRQSALQ